jgi:hypothetical protein
LRATVLFSDASVKGPRYEPVIDKLLNTQEEVQGGTDRLLSFHYNATDGPELYYVTISKPMKQ